MKILVTAVYLLAAVNGLRLLKSLPNNGPVRSGPVRSGPVQSPQKALVLHTYVFGDLPPLFDAFLKTVEKSGADLVIVGDNAPEKLPENVRHHKVSWEGLVQETERIFSLAPGTLATLRGAPRYKVCDLKPFAHVMFPSLIKKYKFFGWVDNDVFLGNLDPLIERLRKSHADFDTGAPFKESFGPISVMRNTPVMSNLTFIMDSPEKRERIVRGVLHSPKTQGFAEWGGKANIRIGDSMTGFLKEAQNTHRIKMKFGFPIMNDWWCHAEAKAAERRLWQEEVQTGTGKGMGSEVSRQSGCRCDVDLTGKRTSIRTADQHEVMLCHLQMGKGLKSLAKVDLNAEKWSYSYPAGIH